MCMLTLYSRISKCNVVDRGVCCAERGERFGDNLRLIIRQFPQKLLQTQDRSCLALENSQELSPLR